MLGSPAGNANTGVNHPMFGTNRSEQTKLKISIVQGTIIYLYSSDKSTLINTAGTIKDSSR